jgi:hypothetical protein
MISTGPFIKTDMANVLLITVSMTTMPRVRMPLPLVFKKGMLNMVKIATRLNSSNSNLSMITSLGSPIKSE